MSANYCVKHRVVHKRYAPYKSCLDGCVCGEQGLRGFHVVNCKFFKSPPSAEKDANHGTVEAKDGSCALGTSVPIMAGDSSRPAETEAEEIIERAKKFIRKEKKDYVDYRYDENDEAVRADLVDKWDDKVDGIGLPHMLVEFAKQESELALQKSAEKFEREVLKRVAKENKTIDSAIISAYEGRIAELGKTKKSMGYDIRHLNSKLKTMSRFADNQTDKVIALKEKLKKVREMVDSAIEAGQDYWDIQSLNKIKEVLSK